MVTTSEQGVGYSWVVGCGAALGVRLCCHGTHHLLILIEPGLEGRSIVLLEWWCVACLKGRERQASEAQSPQESSGSRARGFCGDTVRVMQAMGVEACVRRKATSIDHC
jgi:hypothetical protein